MKKIIFLMTTLLLFSLLTGCTKTVDTNKDTNTQTQDQINTVTENLNQEEQEVLGTKTQTEAETLDTELEDETLNELDNIDLSEW